MDGFINLYKPKNFTSHDALNIIRRSFRGTKIGHGGTLDPDATGVLPVCLGKATRLQDLVMDGDKVYETDIIFGLNSVSLDCSGEVTETCEEFFLDTERLKKVLFSFTGEQEQFPPAVSAIKRNGVPLYKLVRKGIEVETEPRRVRIDKIDLLTVFPDKKHPRVRIAVFCSKGTYIRSLGRDIGIAMGTTAVIDRLERQRCGRFSLENALSLEEIERRCKNKDYSFVMPMECALKNIPRLQISSGEEWKYLLDGRAVAAKGLEEGNCAVYDFSDCLLAVGNVKSEFFQPSRIMWEAPKRKLPLRQMTDTAHFQGTEASAVVIGNFDGMHLGHRYLLEHCAKEAEKRGLVSVLLTFYPHPAALFGKRIVNLSSPEEKSALAHRFGLEMMITESFDSAYASMCGEDFVRGILLERLHASLVYVGDDFTFGKGAAAGAEELKSLCAEFGIEVCIVPCLKMDGEPVSSTRIRAALEEGDISLAAKLYGRPVVLQGKIEKFDGVPCLPVNSLAGLRYSGDKVMPHQGTYLAVLRHKNQKAETAVSVFRTENESFICYHPGEDFSGWETVSITLIGKIRLYDNLPSPAVYDAEITSDLKKAEKYFTKRHSAS